MRHPHILSLCCVLSLAVAGCGDDEPTGPAPTPITPITEQIEGQLTPFSVRIHPFGVNNAGAVTATLTEVTPSDPDSPTRLGVDVGTAIGPTACQVVVSNTSVPPGGAVSATATAAGTLCVRVYDGTADGLPGPVTYRLTLTHF